MTPEEFLTLFLLYVLGTIASLIVTGMLADRLVIRKIMQNKDIQDLIKLFRDGKDYLRKILENQKAENSEEKEA